LRLERNDSFSGGNRYPLLPMLGVATVRSFGDAELKLRAAYGKGIRPPQTPARSAASGIPGTRPMARLATYFRRWIPKYRPVTKAAPNCISATR